MKIVINTNYDSAGTRVCVQDMLPRLIKAGHSVVRNDWEHYDKYDAALFMSPDSQVRLAKEKNPDIITSVMDPKPNTKKRRDEARAADFLLVSSIEQRDFFLRFNKNVLIYYMFPETKETKKVHQEKKKIIIGYHGNKVHLNCFHTEIKEALEELATEHDIELWAMYNVKKLRIWRFGRPNIKIKDVQWSEENYYKFLAKCDIGIVNNMIPSNNLLSRFFARTYANLLGFRFNYDKTDYLVRYKMSANPGRIYVFSQLGIPVVADFTPSSANIIEDGISGYLANSKEGWHAALKSLIEDYRLREEMSRNLKHRIDEKFSPEKNFEAFNRYLLGLRK